MAKEYDIITEVAKFNPYHGADGRFVSGPGGGDPFMDSDDPFMDGGSDMFPWDDIEEVTPSRTPEKQQKNPSNQEIKTELKSLDKHKHLKVYIHEMPDADHTIRAELIGTLPGGNEITFHDGYKIKTADALTRFKEIYAESAAKIDGYHASGYRGL